MKHQLSKISVRDTAEALQVAEAQLERPETNGGSPVFVQVRPQDIRTRLELFQPRRPGYGLRTVDTKHVNKLATRASRKGELDPVLVVKLGHEWVVVDGHHRIAAYLKLKRAEPIRCEWFAGTVREATDESLRRNEKTHLEVDQGDKAEEAWKRTLLGWGSKAQVVNLTGCGEGTVAKMRRVVEGHRKHVTRAQQTPMGEKLCNGFGSDLRRHTWSEVNRVLLDLTPREWDMNDAAAKLARNLVTRMTTKLSEDPEVTARALWLYDRELCPKLIEALQEHMRSEEEEERDLEDKAAYERLEAGD
jgi:hypothetical protein